MKKYVLAFIFVSLAIGLFGNQLEVISKRNISFKMINNDLDLVKNFKSYKYPVSPERLERSAVKSKVAGIVMMSTSAIPIIAPIAFSVVTSSQQYFNFSPLFDSIQLFDMAHMLLLAGTILLYSGIVKEDIAEDFDIDYYNYKMMIVMRNAGAIILGTSAVPLAMTVAGAFAIFMPTYLFYMSFVNIVLNVFYFLGQVVLGSILIGVGAYKASAILDRVSPEFSLGHDDKKDFTEGYSVNVGMRIRI